MPRLSKRHKQALKEMQKKAPKPSERDREILKIVTTRHGTPWSPDTKKVRFSEALHPDLKENPFINPPEAPQDVPPPPTPGPPPKPKSYAEYLRVGSAKPRPKEEEINTTKQAQQQKEKEEKKQKQKTTPISSVIDNNTIYSATNNKDLSNKGLDHSSKHNKKDTYNIDGYYKSPATTKQQQQEQQEIQSQSQQQQQEIQQQQPIDEKAIVKEVFSSIDQERQRLSSERVNYMKQFGLTSLRKKSTPLTGKPKWDDKFAIIAKAFAALGVKETDMAYLLEVHPKTFSKWKRLHPELSTKLKEGEAIRNLGLLQDLMRSSRQGSFAVQIFLAKNWLGMTDRVDTSHSGELKINYISHVPREKGVPEVDPESVKAKPKKINNLKED